MSRPKFSRKAVVGNKGDVDLTATKEVKPFVRDDSDNKLFKDIQIKDITPIITEDCVGEWDFDGVVYRIASNMENKLIQITHKSIQGVVETLPNITTFKGRGKNISETSWLGLKNIDLELKGEPLWTVDDFEVEPLQVLKMDKDKALEQAKIQIHTKIKQVKQQYRISTIRPILGAGDNFRMELNQCRRYKGQRDSQRPLLLKELREWVLSDLKGVFAEPRANGDSIEADDRSNWGSQVGYKHYLKTGKFNVVELSPDKDALGGGGKLLINPDTYTGEHNPLKGKFKYPQAMLIEATHKTAGDVELVIKGSDKTTTKELKGWGFKYLIFQGILGKDQADNYSAFSHLNKGLNFGDVEAYKVLKPCKTAKETLQVALDVAYELLPYGVQYDSHKGESLDVDTLTYLNEYFLTAYMTRDTNDSLTLFKLCELFKVDTSKVVGNNKYTPPVKTYVGCEENIKETEDTLLDIIKSDFKGIKSMRKADQAVVLDRIKEKLESISFESHYEMQQTLKEGFTED